MAYTFLPQVVLNEATQALISNTTGAVFDGMTGAGPLTVTDLTGATITLQTNDKGVLPNFRVDVPVILIDFGSYRTGMYALEIAKLALRIDEVTRNDGMIDPAKIPLLTQYLSAPSVAASVSSVLTSDSSGANTWTPISSLPGGGSGGGTGPAYGLVGDDSGFVAPTGTPWASPTITVGQSVSKQLLDYQSKGIRDAAVKLDTLYADKYDPRRYGAKGDTRLLSKVTSTAAGTTINSSTAKFTSADIGKTVVVFLSASAGTPRKIVSISTANTAVLDGAVGITTAADPKHMAIVGTDDSTAIQAALTAAGADTAAYDGLGDNLAVGNGRNMVRLPSVNQSGFLIGTQLTIPDNVGWDNQGAVLYNALTDRTIPAIMCGKNVIMDTLWVECLLGGGLYVDEDTTQSHFHANVIEMWHPGDTVPAVELHGYHHRIQTFWTKGGGVGILHANSSDDFIDEAYMVGPAVGAQLQGAVNNVHYNHLRGDTVRGAGALLLMNGGCRNINIKAQGFVITPDTLADVIRIGDTSATLNHSIFVEVQATHTGGNVLNIANVNDSVFKVYTSNNGPTSWGANIPNVVAYGANVGDRVDIEATIAAGATPSTGTRAGNYKFFNDGAVIHGLKNVFPSLENQGGLNMINNTVAAGTPTSGATFYANSGQLKVKTPSGTVPFALTYDGTGPTPVGTTSLQALKVNAQTVQSDPAPGPQDFGYRTWAYDPVAAVNNAAITTGTLYLVRMQLRGPESFSKLAIGVVSAGTVTSAFLGVYDSTGTLQRTTADLSATWASGELTGTFSAGFYSPTTEGFFWGAILINATTAPTLARAQGGIANFGSGQLLASQRRFGTAGTGLTALPATITPANIQPVTANNFWAAAV